MPADLNLTATLEGMSLLGGGGLEGIEGLERPGREPTTNSELFEDRNGYEADFLDGWSIPLPQPTGERKDDVRAPRRGGRGIELTYQNFSVVMSASRRLPMLTACNINAAESRRVPRISAWSFDGRLDESDQWGDELYFGNDIDRGHMVRREDPVWGTPQQADRANRDTFHFTNSCPQMGQMNQKTWLSLENYILQNARADGMRVTVFTGPYLTDHDRPFRTTTDDVALIPLAFWKVVAFINDNGRPSATAYKVDQIKELRELEFTFAGFKTYQISVKSVMDDTQIDFSALLPFDGFSQHENAGNERIVEQLESLRQVRV